MNAYKGDIHAVIESLAQLAAEHAQQVAEQRSASAQAESAEVGPWQAVRLEAGSRP